MQESILFEFGHGDTLVSVSVVGDNNYVGLWQLEVPVEVGKTPEVMPEEPPLVVMSFPTKEQALRVAYALINKPKEQSDD